MFVLFSEENILQVPELAANGNCWNSYKMFPYWPTICINSSLFDFEQ